MRRYTTFSNIYVIKLACSASCGNLAEKWTLQNPDAWQQAAFWVLNDMLIVLPSALTGNVKNIRYISVLWNEMMWHFHWLGPNWFADISISQGSVATCLRWGGTFNITALLQISRRMRQWKNFENGWIFDEVMCRLRWLTFFGPPCMHSSAKVTSQLGDKLLNYFLH